MVNNFKFRC